MSLMQFDLRGREPALLVLEDGTSFPGFSVGASGEFAGEVCFNTSMMGYQEILTDPSYSGQMVVMTYPLIGNYGVSSRDSESARACMGGMIMREMSRIRSNWRSDASLGSMLEEMGVLGLEGVDTRSLTRHIRSAGVMKGVLSTVDLDPESLRKKAVAAPGLVGVNLVRGVSTRTPYTVEPDPGSHEGPPFEVVALDFGIKRNVLRLLAARGCRVTVMPEDTSSSEILARDPDGIFLSNGPGDPRALGHAVDTVRELLGHKPVFGICLGHQVLGLALGAQVYKLKFGHRGANQPVMNGDTGRVEITSQNHGFAIERSSIGSGRFGEVELTHWNLNDQTVEGIRCREAGAFSVQHHPEVSPGPHDSRYLIASFTDLMNSWKQVLQG